MMGPMRRWFVLLLIALLPLRGWVGEAMAGEMLGQHIAAASSVQAQQAQAASHPQVQPVPQAQSALHDCMGHQAAASFVGEQEPAQSASGDCPTCASCQVCSSVVLSVDAARLPAAAFGNTLVPRMGTRFASAEPAPAFKPPIS